MGTPSWAVTLAMSCALFGCLRSSTVVCERGAPNERTCPAGTECDDVHHLCGDPIVHYDGATWTDMTSLVPIQGHFQSVWAAGRKDVFVTGASRTA